MSNELAFFAGIVVLLVLVIPLRVNEFVSLMLAAATIGILSGLGASATLDIMLDGFGATVGKIGIIIIFGILLGQYLEDSRAAETLARSVVRAVGDRHAPLAMAMSGYVVGIPVFSDVGYVVMSPLAKAVSRRSGVSLCIIGVSLSAGLLATHVLVPPTPGPLAVAGLLGIDLGRMILWGSFVALFMTLAGWLWAILVIPRYMAPVIPPAPAEIPAEGATGEEDANLPGLGAALIPLALPLVLIQLDTTSRMLLEPAHPFRAFAAAIGDANVAVFLGACAALALLHRRLRAAGKPRLAAINGALGSAGPIIFITAAGGSLGEILEKSGAGGTIADFFAASGMPFLLIPFVISGLLKTVQGSGTIAVITAATLCLPIAHRLQLDPLLIALSAGSGARLVCHVNDSFFWVYANMSGFDTRTALKSLSLANIAMAFGGLAGTWVVSHLI